MDANKDSKPEMEGNASLMSDQIVEKLKLLDYENLFTKVKGHHPLTKTYFVTKSPNAGEQNVYFIALSSWLVNLCGGKISGDKKYDDPVTMANNLLTEMKNIGIDCSVPPNQLRAGYGVPICTVLLLLVNKALEKKGFAFKRPKFDDQGKVNTREAPDIEDEAPDLINNEIDYGDNVNNEKGAEGRAEEEKNEDDDGTKILFSGTSAEDWQRELEKVSSKLKMNYDELNSFGNSEWRAHIYTIKENETKFTKEIPDSRAVLENLSTEIDKSLEKITKKEEVISKNHSNIIKSYKEKHTVSSNQLEEYKQLNETVDNLKRELEEITDKIAQSNEKYEKLSNAVNDTSALGNMKLAIQKIQNENLTMDMKINILNHSLLKYLHDGDNYKVAATEGPSDNSMYEEVL